MTCVIRQARPEEADALPAIERSAATAFRGSAHDWIADDQVSPAEFHRPFAEAGLVWVADLGERLAGFLTSETFLDGLHIWELAVSHGHQGRGIGRQLVQAAIEAARERGLPAVTLTTFYDIPWNAPFYARLGFSQPDPRDLPERLRANLSREAARGLAHRCAMRLDL